MFDLYEADIDPHYHGKQIVFPDIVNTRGISFAPGKAYYVSDDSRIIWYDYRTGDTGYIGSVYKEGVEIILPTTVFSEDKMRFYYWDSDSQANINGQIDLETGEYREYEWGLISENEPGSELLSKNPNPIPLAIAGDYYIFMEDTNKYWFIKTEDYWNGIPSFFSAETFERG